MDDETQPQLATIFEYRSTDGTLLFAHARAGDHRDEPSSRGEQSAWFDRVVAPERTNAHGLEHWDRVKVAMRDPSVSVDARLVEWRTAVEELAQTDALVWWATDRMLGVRTYAPDSRRHQSDDDVERLLRRVAGVEVTGPDGDWKVSAVDHQQGTAVLRGRTVAFA